MSNILLIIKNLKLSNTNLENYNYGLATESYEQQAKIEELADVTGDEYHEASACTLSPNNK